jgi:hypothetical protein
MRKAVPNYECAMSDPERDAMPAKDQGDGISLPLLPLICRRDIGAVARPMFAAYLPIRGVGTIQFGLFKHPAKPLSEFSKNNSNLAGNGRWKS